MSPFTTPVLLLSLKWVSLAQKKKPMCPPAYWTFGLSLQVPKLNMYKTEVIIFFIWLSELRNHLTTCWSQKPKCQPRYYLLCQLHWAVKSFTCSHSHCNYLISCHHRLLPDIRQYNPTCFSCLQSIFHLLDRMALLKFKTGIATSLLVVSHQALDKIQTPSCDLISLSDSSCLTL